MKIHRSLKTKLFYTKPSRIVLIVTVLFLAIGTIVPLFNFKSASADQSAWTSIASGSYHTCGISNGQAYCWGYNANGQLGNNTTNNSSVRVVVDTSGVLSGKTLTAISAGGVTTCALDTNGQAYCWGDNANGQLGNNTTNNSLVPVVVDMSGALAGKRLAAISTSGVTTCALDTNGQAYCWGDNHQGQLGDNTGTNNSSVPVAVDMSGALAGKRLAAISVSDYHICALDTNGQAYCWGNNYQGQLGNNTITNNSSVPVVVDTSGVLSGKTLTAISVGGFTTCALDTNGKAYCWGFNNYGQLGNNTTNNSSVPVAVDMSGVLSGKTLTAISARVYHTCALDANGQAYCWGYNANGQLGNNTTDDSSVPVVVDTSGVLSGKTLTAISAGVVTTCALDANGQAYCWGDNNYGQLGNGDLTVSSVSTPSIVLLVAPVAPVAPVLGVTGVNFSNQSGESLMEINGTVFPDYANALTRSLVSLNNVALPFCSKNIGLDAQGLIQAFNIDPSLVSDTPACYFLMGSPSTVNFTSTQAIVWLPDGFNITAPGTVSIDGSPVFSFNQPTGGGQPGSDGSTPPTGVTQSNIAHSMTPPTTTHIYRPTSTSDATNSTAVTTDKSSVTAPSVITSGVALSDNQTISSLPTFSGTAAPNSTVTVTVHSDPITCTTKADASGNWTCTLSTALPVGQHTVYVAVTTPDGQTSNLGPYTVFVKASTSTVVTGKVSGQPPIAIWAFVALGIVALLALLVVVIRVRLRTKTSNK